MQWRISYPNARVHHFSVTNSDHVPLILHFFRSEPRVATCFKFETFWAREVSCYGVIVESWRKQWSGSPAWILFNKIREVWRVLRKWNVETFGAIHDRIVGVKEQLSLVQQAEPSDDNICIEKCLLIELDEQLQREEILWKQKLRVSWLTSGDLNTKFYHASMIIRRCRNRIVELKDQTGGWISGRQNIGQELVSFYSVLYTLDRPNIPFDLDNLVESIITMEENAELIRIPDWVEMWETLKRMPPDKAPGPDGMTVFFFRQF